MSALFDNAIDSLKMGMRFFHEKNEKHAILSVFHCVELLLKELLFRRHPILIYHNINKRIDDHSFTVGFRDALIRFENIGVYLSAADKKTIESLQKRRNQIEHHKYEPQSSDSETLGRTLRFLMRFAREQLKCDIHEHIEVELFKSIQKLISTYEERVCLADHTLGEWIARYYPNNSGTSFGQPGHFDGTEDCPICRQTYLVIDDPHLGTYCFFCQSKVNARNCEMCHTPFVHKSHDEKNCSYCESQCGQEENG